MALRNAEQELEKGSSDGNEKAIFLYEKVIADPSFQRLSLSDGLPIYLKLAEIFGKNNHWDRFEKLLSNLILDPHMAPYRVELKTALAQGYLLQGKLIKADKILAKLLKIPPKTLSLEERSTVFELARKIQERYEEIEERAQTQLQMKNWQKAIPYYEQLYDALCHHLYPKSDSPCTHAKTKSRLFSSLGACYFFSGDFVKAESLLLQQDYAQNDPQTVTELHQSLQLLALSEKENGHFKEALKALQTYIANEKDPSRVEEAAFEAQDAALSLYDFETAALLQKMVSSSAMKQKNELLRAKEAFYKGKEADAFEIIKKLAGTPIESEALFFKGKLLYEKGDLENGAVALEEALRTAADLNPIKPKIYGYLAKCYLDLARHHPDLQLVYLERSVTCFSNLKGAGRFFGLAQVYYLADSSQPQLAKEKIETLLKESLPDLSQADIERAHVIVEQFEKSETPQNHPSKKSLLLQALNECKEQRFKEALSSFDFALKKHLEWQKAVPYLLAMGQKEASQKALSLVQKDPCENARFFETLILWQTNPQGAANQATKFLEENPSCPQGAAWHHLLGLIFFDLHEDEQALFHLTTALNQFPLYEKKDHLLFVSSFLVEKKDFELARSQRKELVSKYLLSAYAPEAYFRIFPEKEYTLGSPPALNHLGELIKLFPQSAWAIAAHYYIGQFSKDESDAISHFENAILIFETLSKQLLGDPALYNYFESMQIATLIELGRRGKEEHLKKVISHLEEKFKKKESSPDNASSYEEALYLLAEIYGSQNFFDLARKQLLSLVEWEQQNKLTSDFLIKAYIALAQGEQKMKKFKESLDWIDLAEKGATRSLLLEVRIAKSALLKEMGRLDEAMMVLSKTINDSCASQVRIKAMFLRAELYELKQRHDLAIKQLEACAKKGGEWGKKAKEKLELTYGYK